MSRVSKFNIVAVKAKRVLRLLGPGLVTGASDDDPSGIATYTQSGAQFGFATLWTALVTFPLMASIQGMCARIGLVTAQGLTVTLKRHYSKPLLYVMLLFSFPAITLNIGADIQAMGAVANMVFSGNTYFCILHWHHRHFDVRNHPIPLSENCNDLKMALLVLVAILDCSVHDRRGLVIDCKKNFYPNSSI